MAARPKCGWEDDLRPSLPLLLVGVAVALCGPTWAQAPAIHPMLPPMPSMEGQPDEPPRPPKEPAQKKDGNAVVPSSPVVAKHAVKASPPPRHGVEQKKAPPRRQPTVRRKRR